jgi:hypothetical protein
MAWFASHAMPTPAGAHAGAKCALAIWRLDNLHCLPSGSANYLNVVVLDMRPSTHGGIRYCLFATLNAASAGIVVPDLVP